MMACRLSPSNLDSCPNLVFSKLLPVRGEEFFCAYNTLVRKILMEAPIATTIYKHVGRSSP
jgi:hypothetical protein